WNYLEPVVLAANANHLLDPLVVGRQFIVSQRPVFLDAVHGPSLEISLRASEHHGIPVHGPATHDANPVHADGIAVLVANRTGHTSLVEGRLLLTTKSSVRKFVRPFVRQELIEGNLSPCLKHDELRSALA